MHARAGLPHDVGGNSLGGRTPFPSLQTQDRAAPCSGRVAESPDLALNPPLRGTENLEPPSGPPAEEIAAVRSPADAEELFLLLTQVMDGLLAVVEEETQLIRCGHTAIPAHVEQSKADLARRYSAGIARLQSSQPYLRQMLPVSFAVLHHRHESFRALLQINLTLLAAERAAAQPLIDGQSAEAPVEDLSTEPAGASWAPHRPRPVRTHLPRLAQARCCPLPRRLQQTGRDALRTEHRRERSLDGVEPATANKRGADSEYIGARAG
jgi:hypothetical protein